MRIKQVVIHGFKTYKNRTVIEPFHEGFNLVLGRNGSGKSNILDAIQFVLSDKYANMSLDRRRKLLHEGSGRDTTEAYVEIIFDNRDMRLHIESETVSIARHIALKKDEYALQGKNCRKSEIRDLLESAGLSQDNPYNIVQQGEVQRLTSMDPPSRLELLKEIAGTRTYDDRRKESMKIMKDSDGQRERIEEVITFVETRLNELQEEKEDLQAYQRLDTERRCLEHTILDKELRSATEKLEVLDKSREDYSEKATTLHAAAAAAATARADAEEELKAVQEALVKNQVAIEQSKDDHRELLTQVARLELAVSDSTERAALDGSARTDAQATLDRVQQQIEKVRLSFATAQTEHARLLEEETQLRETLLLADQKAAELLARQGRMQQFRSKAERDRFLDAEIAKMAASLEAEEKQLSELMARSRKLEADERRLAADETKGVEKVAAMRVDIDACQQAVDDFKKQRDAASNARKEMWKKDHDLEKKVALTRSELEKANKQLHYTMDKHQARGLATVMRYAKEQSIPGVYGPLIELVQSDEKFHKSVETTAGNALFHVVVDTDATAARLIAHLTKEKTGRVTFMPLNQLQDYTQQYPKSSEAFPMIDRLQFHSRYRRAVQQVFGRTLIARNLDVGATLAKDHGLTAITLDGDQVNQKGAITGGFIDYKFSRMKSQDEVTKLTEELEILEEQLAQTKDDAAKEDQAVARILGEVQKEAARKNHLRHNLATLQEAASQRQRNQQIARKAIEENQRQLRELGLNLKKSETHLMGLRTERASAMDKELSAVDLESLSSLQAAARGQREQLTAASTALTNCAIEKSRLENTLQNNLLRQESELLRLLSSPDSQGDVQGASQGDGDGVQDESLESLRAQLAQCRDREREALAELTAAEKALTDSKKRDRELQQLLEALRADETRHEENVSREAKWMERLHGKRSMLQQKKEDCIRRIVDLGAVPSGLERYAKRGVQALMKQLEKCTRELKKYRHVNKKALDQFLNFTQKREELGTRFEELRASRESILELIQHLDQQKDEAIQRSFKLIAKEFTRMFSALVPDGQAKLVIHTRGLSDDDEEGEGAGKQQEEEEEDDDDEEEEKKKTKKKKNKHKDKQVGMTAHYSGIGMEVSFNGAKQTMRQLSGGQQTVVALSLIFAIQRCDPSPFYIFDEIDSNLDTVHRTSVAKMIARQAKGQQFIATTQHREMLEAANQTYAVSFHNRVSNVSTVSAAHARELMQEIERDAQQEEEQ